MLRDCLRIQVSSIFDRKSAQKNPKIDETESVDSLLVVQKAKFQRSSVYLESRGGEDDDPFSIHYGPMRSDAFRKYARIADGRCDPTSRKRACAPPFQWS